MDHFFSLKRVHSHRRYISYSINIATDVENKVNKIERNHTVAKYESYSSSTDESTGRDRVRTCGVSHDTEPKSTLSLTEPGVYLRT